MKNNKIRKEEIVVRILFQGDSITDAARNRENIHDLGNGYPKYAAQLIKDSFSDKEFEFINLGISGNQTKDLVQRLQTDFIDIQPDIVSILIGINDVWHNSEGKKWLSNQRFEDNYRTVLSAIKEKTNAKIIILEPFLIPVEDKLFFREDLDPKIQIIRKLAYEFADIYVPTDGLFAAVHLGNKPTDFANDGVHPTEKGAKLIANHYFAAISNLFK